jgi:hypothetical protein
MRDQGGLMWLRSVCPHDRHVVHPVVGGYRAHCLRCGQVGTLCKSRVEARTTISSACSEVRRDRADVLR